MKWHAPDIQRISVAAVHVAPGRRPVTDAAVVALMASIEAQGLHTPITVRHVDVMDLPDEGEVHGVPVLVAGRHRLEAARRLGWDMIPCVFMAGDERDARLWEIAENLHRADLSSEERRQQIAGTLSGGEQQMVAIGRALMARPRLICMDEPSMGLSPLFVEQVFDIIQAINRQGTTIFMVEQNAAMALQIAHRAYVLQTGVVVLSGTAAELRENEDIKQAYLGEMQVGAH